MAAISRGLFRLMHWLLPLTLTATIIANINLVAAILFTTTSLLS
jgi:hypothetical protein